MKRIALLGMVLLLAGALMVTSLAQAARPVLDVGTPTVAVYLPVVMKQSTPTPTSTATPTATATVTQTPPPSGPGDFTGTFTMAENKQSYATNIENIQFYELLQNVRSYPVRFGIMGVQVAGPQNFFHTSWDGGGAGGYLSINGNCYGPNGMPCAPNPDAGRHLDSVVVNVPGGYALSMYVCYSSFSGCQTAGGVWQQLGQTQNIVAIDWTPQPGIVGQATPAPTEPCRLITDDPRGIYLQCKP